MLGEPRFGWRGVRDTGRPAFLSGAARLLKMTDCSLAPEPGQIPMAIVLGISMAIVIRAFFPYENDTSRM